MATLLNIVNGNSDNATQHFWWFFNARIEVENAMRNWEIMRQYSHSIELEHAEFSPQHYYHHNHNCINKISTPTRWELMSQPLPQNNLIKINFLYSQFTLNVTVVSYFSPSFIARLKTTHRKRAPSSSFVGVMVSVLVVWWSFEPPRFTIACNCVLLPSRYHLWNWRWHIVRIDTWQTHGNSRAKFNFV